MTSAIQGATTAVSEIAAGGCAQFFLRWKGRGIQLLTHLSIEMHRKPLKALFVVVSANALFYVLVSHQLVRSLDHRFNPSEEPDDHSFRHVAVIGPLTIIFNIAFAKLTQYQLSRITLLMITTAIISLRMLYMRRQ
jgi:hypothetical protein